MCDEQQKYDTENHSIFCIGEDLRSKSTYQSTAITELYKFIKLKNNENNFKKNCFVWSGRWDSNPRHQPWQGCTLPLSYARLDSTS